MVVYSILLNEYYLSAGQSIVVNDARKSPFTKKITLKICVKGLTSAQKGETEMEIYFNLTPRAASLTRILPQISGD